MVAIAVANCRVGIDVESSIRAVRMRGIADQICHRDEVGVVPCDAGLLALWVRKEALLKATGQRLAMAMSRDYFDNNITGTLHLLRAMRNAGVPWLVFSSSATVYGDPERVPVDEDAPLRVTNPYGRTKLVMESMIADVCASAPGLHAVNLRSFNPVGAHPSGLIGEDPEGVPDNLMPYICQAAVGRRARRLLGRAESARRFPCPLRCLRLPRVQRRCPDESPQRPCRCRTGSISQRRRLPSFGASSRPSRAGSRRSLRR